MPVRKKTTPTKTEHVLDSGITYTVRSHHRAKNITLSIHANGEITVTVPRRVAKREAHAFVESRKAWIKRALEQLAEKQKKAPQVEHDIPADSPAARKKARVIIGERIAALNNAYYGFRVGRISIRHTKTRWGSCSAEGNLNFSYKVAFLPPEIRDYVIIHELSHLKHMNHSKSFWSLVSKADPEYALHRKILQRYSFV